MKELTVLQIEFLKILESFMHDKQYQLPEDFSDFEILFQMAGKHKVLSVVYEQIRNDAMCRAPEYAPIINLWKRAAVKEVMLQMQRTEGFLSIYEKLCQAGLKPLVMKGLICRNLYTKSDYRTSGDEDILLAKSHFTICDSIMKQEGFTREDLDESNLPYEIPYLNPKNGTYIELHFSLFPEESGAYGHLNDAFEDIFERCICEKIQGKDVWTMGPTDHLFYLICHSFKHFLHSGFGMRQLCDMIVMSEHYGDQIDWLYIKQRLETLNMDTYWKALVEIGVLHLGFSLERSNYPVEMRAASIDFQPMLKDLLDSGIYGDSSMERKHSANMTLAAAAGGKASTANSLKTSLFPDKSYMKGTFPWLEKYPYLLGIAYIIRIGRYLKRSSQNAPADGQNSVQIGMDRVELLRTYRIIK